MKTDTLTFFVWLFIFVAILYILFDSVKPVHADSDWTAGTQKKLDAMVSLGWDETIARELILKCKETAKDPSRCVSIGNFIGFAESSGGKYTNVFGVLKYIEVETDKIDVLTRKKIKKLVLVKPKTKIEALNDWVERYNKYWYNMTKPSQFYGKGAVTGYCKSEKGHKKNWCPNGLKNATRAYKYFISKTK